MQTLKENLASPTALVIKNPPTNAGDARDLDLIPGSGRSLREGHGNTLQYSCLGESLGQRRLVGCGPWGCRESDTTEVT